MILPAEKKKHELHLHLYCKTCDQENHRLYHISALNLHHFFFVITVKNTSPFGLISI